MDNFNTGQVVYHENHGTGRVVNMDETRITVNFIKAGVKFFSHSEAEDELSDTPFYKDTGADSVEIDEDSIKNAIREVLFEEGLIGSVAIAEKWDGGELIMKPGKTGLQEKAIPIETFFHKIVMIRNQLRVLEANINASKNLSDSEKVDLQQYITRCYGSLTTFNVLFADKKEWFVGSKKED